MKYLSLQEITTQKLCPRQFSFIGEKVAVLISDTCSLPREDEAAVRQTFENIIGRRGKGYLAWLNNGMLTVKPDILDQFLRQGTVTTQPNPPPSVTWERVMLKSKLRNGEISYKGGDVEIHYPGFEVPDYIIDFLQYEHCTTPVAVIKIVLGTDGKLGWSVDPKRRELSKGREAEVAATEILMLKTCMRYGKVSFAKAHVEYCFSNFQLPLNVTKGLERNYCDTPKAKLYILSDEKGNLRTIVHVGNWSRFRASCNKHLKEPFNTTF